MFTFYVIGILHKITNTPEMPQQRVEIPVGAHLYNVKSNGDLSASGM